MTGLDIAYKLAQYGVPWEHAKILAAVAYGESGYNPKAELITPYEDSVGLFQINMKAHGDKLERWTGTRNVSVWRQWLMNVENNIFAASQVYKSQGLTAWTIYNQGKYIPYLDKLDKLQVKSGSESGKTPAVESKDKSLLSNAFSSEIAIAGGAIILAVVVAAGVALVIAGGLKNA